jgi:hypothetical protein
MVMLKSQNSVALVNKFRHRRMASHLANQLDTLLHHRVGGAEFAGAGSTGTNEQSLGLGLAVEGMEEVVGLGHDGDQFDRFPFKHYFSFHSFRRHVEAVQQHMDKTEGMVTKGEKDTFLHGISLLERMIVAGAMMIGSAERQPVRSVTAR